MPWLQIPVLPKEKKRKEDRKNLLFRLLKRLSFWRSNHSDMFIHNYVVFIIPASFGVIILFFLFNSIRHMYMLYYSDLLSIFLIEVNIYVTQSGTFLYMKILSPLNL